MNVPATHILYKDLLGGQRLAISYSQIDTFHTCPMKWYKTYVEGDRSVEKQEATSYGTVVHKTLEYFFKNGKKPTGKDLGDAISYFAYQEEIPWSSIESMLIATKQSGELLVWLAKLFRKNRGKFFLPDSELNPCERLIRYGTVIGVEEDFVLPYRLPNPININGVEHTHVYIVGSVDLHLAMKNNGIIHHYVIDWKSGKKMFDQNKLDTNLQHPIYSFYIYRNYEHSLPDMNLYFFTRTREYQKVKIDVERVKKSIDILNDTLSKMYNFDDKSITQFQSYEQTKDGSRYVKKQATLDKPMAHNQLPCPSALCYFCDFGMYKKNNCPFSSDWDPSKKINK